MAKTYDDTIVKQRLQIEDLKKGFEDVNVKINDFYRQLEQLHIKVSVPSEFIEFRGEMGGHRVACETFQEWASINLKTLKTRADSFDKALSTVESIAHSTSNRLTHLLSSISDHEILMSSRINRFKEEQDTTIAGYKAAMDRQMKCFKDSLQASPASILDSNKEIAKTLKETMQGLENGFQRLKNIDLLISNLESQVKAFDSRLRKVEGK